MKRTSSITCLLVLLMLVADQAIAQPDFEMQLSSYGLAMPRDSVVLRSSIETWVERILVREGQYVAKGDLLVELHSDSARARCKIAKLEAEETGPRQNAEAELKYAKRYYQQIVTLAEQHAVNVRELNEASLRLESARAILKMEAEKAAVHQARHELAEAELNEHFIRAPFDGQITHLHLNVGDSVFSDTKILQLISADVLRVELYIGTGRAASLDVGDPCPLEIQEPFDKQIINATIVFRSPMIEATTGTLRFVMEIDNRELKLPAGFTVAVADRIEATNPSANPPVSE